VVVRLRLDETPPALDGALDAAGATAYLAAVRASFDVASADVRATLAAEARAGRVTRVDDLWLADALAITATPDVVARLAARPEVRLIAPEPMLAPEPGVAPDKGPRGSHDGATGDDVTGYSAPPNRSPLDPDGAAAEWGVRLIHADDVWRRLGVDGTGVTIGVVDTGVDYHHPLLQARFRGHVGDGRPQLDGNWWCHGGDPFCGRGARYPVDGEGHGTHVVGSALSGDGIGVAPGARWIAARACSVQVCPFSWIVGAVEWLVGLTADRRPDVVNFSLGTTNPIEILLFQPLFNRLAATDIVVVAATGNSRDQLQAPAAFTGTIGVGAVTPERDVWPSSGRGLSPWNEVKPDVVAPGAGITSTWPGGGLQRLTGTSMATPHVAGVAALLLQARPDLTPAEVKAVLTRTATPLNGGRVDPDSGWGLVNAYAAVASVTDAGTLSGRVARAADGGAIPWARVVVADELGNPMSEAPVNPADGRFAVDLHPGRYLIVAKAFGFHDKTLRVTIEEKVTVSHDFALEFAEPMGIFAGRLFDAATGAPLDGELRLEGVPFTIASDETSGFSQRLPPQVYNVRIVRFGYRVKADTVKISPGETTSVIYQLEPAPKILLVDGDAWNYGNTLDFYRASLDRLGYVFHEHHVTDQRAGAGKPGGPPAAAALAPYDIVIWSSALGSLNVVRAANDVLAYLDGGGRLLLSGQDILCYDAGRDVGSFPCEPNALPHPYIGQKLGLRVVSDQTSSRTVVGTPGGPLAGITLTLNGGDSLDNQATPDVLAVTDAVHGRQIATYGDGQGAAALVDTCVQHRALVLGFGFEGIAGAARRDQVMARVIDALVAPPRAHGVYARPAVDTWSRPAGATADYTVTLFNTGTAETHYALALEGAKWPAELWEGGLVRPLAGPLRLGGCDQTLFVVRVRVPPATSRGASDTIRLRVRAEENGAEQVLALTTRTPSPVLLVDGDYDRQSEARYHDALRAAGVGFDTWELGLFKINPPVPTTRTLAEYPAVVWFTGYDVLRPDGSLNRESQRVLADYLGAGGRLLLSSEDFLRHWGQTPYRDDRLFHRDYLGVGSYADDGGAAHAGPMSGADGSVLAGLAGCRLPARDTDLDVSDRVTPLADRSVRAALFDVYDQPVATQVESTSGFKTLFLALDAGLLDPTCADAVVARAMDWFSPFSGSQLALVDAQGQVETRRAFAGGDTVRLRLQVANGGPRAVGDAGVVWALPPGGSLVTPTIPAGGWAWDAAARTLAWRGRLERFEALAATVDYALDRDLPAGADMVATAEVGGEGITVTRRAAWHVNAADLSGSSKSVPDPQRDRRYGETAKFVVNVTNRGTRPAEWFVVTDTLPVGLTLVADSLFVEQGEARVAAPGMVLWRGPSLPPHGTATLSYLARVTTRAGGWLRNEAVLVDDAGTRLALSAAVFARPQLVFPWLGWERDLDP